MKVIYVFSGSHLQSEQKRNQTDNYPTGSDKSGVIQFQNDKPIRCKLACTRADQKVIELLL